MGERSLLREPYRRELDLQGRAVAVLSGRLRLKLPDKEFVPEPGDAGYFDAERSRRLSALGENDVEIILVACSIPCLLLTSYL